MKRDKELRIKSRLGDDRLFTAVEVDEKFDFAIQWIGLGDETFSCLAVDDLRPFYERVLSVGLKVPTYMRGAPRVDDFDLLLHGMRVYVTGKKFWKKEHNFCMSDDAKMSVVTRDLRIVMLSLMRVAWRDLVDERGNWE